MTQEYQNSLRNTVQPCKRVKTDMTVEENAIHTFEVGEAKQSADYKISALPPISSTLKLDSLLKDGTIEVHDIFEQSQFSKVVNLSMKDNGLSHLPTSFHSNLFTLRKLNLSDNKLVELSIGIEALLNLRELIVDDNKLKALPANIGKLVNLRYFSAKGNQLTTIPESLGELVDIEEINLSQNKIKTVPDSYANFRNLISLNLSYNEMSVSPTCVFQGTPRLRTLNLSYNHITDFTRPPCSHNLKLLYLNNNAKNEQFPGWLITERLANLEEVVLDHTIFASFDVVSKAPQVSHLKKLSMVNCVVSDTTFEPILNSFNGLENLRIGNDTMIRKGNVFWMIPVQSFKNPSKLIELDIQNVGLPVISPEINLLQNLKVLNISRNTISCLPEEICQLEQLELLNCSYNNLYTLPKGIGNLKALKILLLESNQLASLPESIEDSFCLEYLDLYDNEFTEVPIQIGKIPKLRALDIDANIFSTENLQIPNIEYLMARDILRASNNISQLRVNREKVLSEDQSSDSYYESKLMKNGSLEDNKSSKEHTNHSLSDVRSVENWDLSDDLDDEFDPTAPPKHYASMESSFLDYGKFCPADMHVRSIREQLAAMERLHGKPSSTIEEGQFDDA